MWTLSRENVAALVLYYDGITISLLYGNVDIKSPRKCLSYLCFTNVIVNTQWHCLYSGP